MEDRRAARVVGWPAIRRRILWALLLVAVVLAGCGGSNERAKLVGQVRSGLIHDTVGGLASVDGVPLRVTPDLIDCIVQGARGLPIGQLRQLVGGKPSEAIGVGLVGQCLSAGHDVDAMRAALAGLARAQLPSDYGAGLGSCLAAYVGSLSGPQLDHLLRLAVGGPSAQQQLGVSLAVTCMHEHPALIRDVLILGARDATRSSPRLGRCLIDEIKRLPSSILDGLVAGGTSVINPTAALSIRSRLLAACGRVPAAP